MSHANPRASGHMLTDERRLRCAPRDLCACDSRATALRSGAVFRSCAMPAPMENRPMPLQHPRFATAVDLRTERERAGKPSPLAAEASRRLHLPMPQVASAPVSYAALLLGRRIAAVTEEIVCEDYLRLVATSATSLNRLFIEIGDAKALPLVFYCSAGRDRTGIVAALLLSILDVAQEDILRDYEATPRRADSDDEILSMQFRSAGIDLAAYRLTYTASQRSMRLFLQALADRHGDIHGFLLKMIELRPDDIDRVRKNLLVVGQTP